MPGSVPGAGFKEPESNVKLRKVDGPEVLQRISADPNLKATLAVVSVSSCEERDLLKSFRDLIGTVREDAFFRWGIDRPPSITERGL